MTSLIAIPAAGASRRMRGRDKLLETVDGYPLLRRQAIAALATGRPVAVLLPPDSVERNHALSGLNVERIEVPDSSTGISASLRAAAKRAAGHDALAILLPDVPGIGAQEIAEVLDTFDKMARDAVHPPVVRATDPAQRPGTPVVIPSRLFAGLRRLDGDDGGKRLFHDEAVHLVRFRDDRATRDLDTPEDWATWRQRDLGGP